MKADRYTAEVKALKKSGDDILKELTATEASALHMLVGLLDEYFELGVALVRKDMDNANEEIGDFMFYLNGLCQDLNIVPAESAEQIALSNGVMLLNEAVKRHIFYRKPLDHTSVSEIVGGILVGLNRLIEAINPDWTMESILDNNINKLHKRYKEKSFSNEAAQERADKDTVH